MPKLSIAAKLYAIFALITIAAVALDWLIDWDAPLWVSAPAVGVIIGMVVCAVLSARGIARSLASLANVTEAVAAGDATIAVPCSGRKDEIGALARSIAVFQVAMRNNTELASTVRAEAEMRTERQEQMSGEIARFSAGVEASGSCDPPFPGEARVRSALSRPSRPRRSPR